MPGRSTGVQVAPRPDEPPDRRPYPCHESRSDGWKRANARRAAASVAPDPDVHRTDADAREVGDVSVLEALVAALTSTAISETLIGKLMARRRDGDGTSVAESPARSITGEEALRLCALLSDPVSKEDD